MSVSIPPMRRARLRKLIEGAVREPGTDAPRGATDEELSELASRLGRPLPDSLYEWLKLCRGGRIGPGGLYGATPNDPFTDMAARATVGWLTQGWFPVAGDGCGDTYVLTEDCSIGFIDPIRSLDDLDSIVAPDLWSFVEDLLAGDQAQR